MHQPQPPMTLGWEGNGRDLISIPRAGYENERQKVNRREMIEPKWNPSDMYYLQGIQHTGNHYGNLHRNR